MFPTTPSADPRPAAERLADILTYLQRRFILKLSAELSQGNVSFAQYCLLGFLSNDSHLSMTEIANRMGHTTAAATGLVDRLESLGYAKRVHGANDRRKILVQITPTGTALVGKVRNDMAGSLLQIMDRLTPEERGAWLQIYEKIYLFCQEDE